MSIKMLFILQLTSEDYTTALNKILFHASCFGNSNIIEILAEIPCAEVKHKMTLEDPLDVDNTDFNESGEGPCKKISFLESNINSTDRFGYTPLFHATTGGFKRVVQILLNYGAIVIVTNKDKDTPLILASKNGYQKIVKKFLFSQECRDDIDVKGFGGDSAFLCAAKQSIYALEKNREDNYLNILKLLAAHGADVNISDDADLCAIDWAAKEGKIRLVGILLDLKAHLNKQNQERLEVALVGLASYEEKQELLERIKVLEERAVKIKVKLRLKKKPYGLSFSIGSLTYFTRVGDTLTQENFAEEIGKLYREMLVRIGEKIVAKVLSMNDKNDQELSFQLIFGQILYNPYFLAKKANKPSMNRVLSNIRELVKPLFRAFPRKGDSVYIQNLKKYNIDL